MGYLLYHGSLSPLHYDQMLWPDVLAVYERVRRLVETRQAVELEHTKALIQASGAKLG